MALVIEAGMEITIKAGANFIKLDPAGVAIQGTMVMLNSGGAPGTGSGASPANPTDAKEAKTK
jgi:type VI secretion system secreted protein VgrG